MSEAPTHYTGGCRCGAVRFEAGIAVFETMPPG